MPRDIEGVGLARTPKALPYVGAGGIVSAPFVPMVLLVTLPEELAVDAAACAAAICDERMNVR